MDRSVVHLGVVVDLEEGLAGAGWEVGSVVVVGLEGDEEGVVDSVEAGGCSCDRLRSRTVVIFTYM